MQRTVRLDKVETKFFKGIFASPSVKRFDNDEEDVVPDSQGEQQQDEDESSFKSSPTREDFLLDEPRSLVTSSHLQTTET